MKTSIHVLMFNRDTGKYHTKVYETDAAEVDSLGILHIGPKAQTVAWFNKDSWVAVDRIEEPEGDDEPVGDDEYDAYDDAD